MASEPTEPSRERGARIAHERGWPKSRMGFIGALGGLGNIGEPFRGWVGTRRALADPDRRAVLLGPVDPDEMEPVDRPA